MNRIYVELKDKHSHMKSVPILQQLKPTVINSILTLTNQKSNHTITNSQQWCSFIYLNPFSTFCAGWNLIMIIVVYMIEIQVSLIMGFNPTLLNRQINANFFIPTLYSVVVFLIIDIFLNFHKGFYAQGQGRIIDSPKQIFLRYIKSYFSIDIICIVFLLLIPNYNNFGVNFLQIIPLILFWIKKFNCQSQLEIFLQYNKMVRIVFILVMLFLDVFILAHFGACIFAGMDLILWQYQYFSDNTQYYWLSNDTSYSVDLLPGYWVDQYIFAMSFSLGTLSTLAPGPFGKNQFENFFMIILMSFFMILASYCADVLVNLFFFESQKRVFHQNNIIKFDKLMKLKAVNNSLKNRVHDFLELVWQFEVKMENDAQKKLINKLPPKLKNKFLLEIGFIKIIKFIQYLPNYSQLQILLTNQINQIILQPFTLIFQQGQKGITKNSRSLFFIQQGIAKFYLQKNSNPSFSSSKFSKTQQHILSLSNVGKLLGSYQFVTGIAHSYSCQPIDLCVINFLNYNDFKKSVIQSQGFEQVAIIRQDVMLGQKLELINKKCVICLNEHIESKCDSLHVNLKIKNNIFEKNLSIEQIRKSINRNSFIRSRKMTSLNGYRKKEIFNFPQNAYLREDDQYMQQLIQHTKIDIVYGFQKYRKQYNINNNDSFQ